MMNCHNITPVRGFGLVEIIVGVSIITLVMAALFGFFQLQLKATRNLTYDIQATLLAQEGIEAARSMRDESWEGLVDSVTNGTAYHLAFSGGNWATTTVPTTIDGRFTRTIQFDEVERDAEDDIVASGGSVDDGTRFVTVTVSWLEGGDTKTKQLRTYLSNILKN